MPEWLQSQTLRNALVSIAIVAAAAVAAALVRVILCFVLRLLTVRSRSDLDERIIRALHRPAGWAIVLGGLYLALIRLEIWSTGQAKFIAEAAGVGAILLGVHAALRVFNTAAQWYTEAAAERSTRPREVQAQALVGRKVVSILILLMGILIVLRHLGIEIGPLLAGLGLGGLAVALALQDTLSNLFAGIYMMVDRPVTVGDFIKLESGEEGFVEEIGWRNTKVRMFANNIVIIPNAKLSQSVLTNYYLPKQELSVYVNCGVAYESDLEHVERVCIEVAKQTMARVPGSATDWEPVVRFKEFADFSINFVVVLRVQEFAAQFALAHEYVKALHRRFRQEGIEIPFPIRTVIMRSPQGPELALSSPAEEAQASPPGWAEEAEGRGG